MLDSIRQVTPPPAQKPYNGCKHARRCEAEALALFRRVSTNPKRWSQAPRLLSRDLFERAMEPVKRDPPVHRRRAIEEESEVEAE
jgi:hypothetical protein